MGNTEVSRLDINTSSEKNVAFLAMKLKTTGYFLYNHSPS